MRDITDLRATIVPKSDQINAEQLMSGPIDITVTDVRIGATDEQPVTIHYQNDNGQPYKPCKTMRKVLLAVWGIDGRDWIGKSMRLFCDPFVKFGGEEVGGIRISHLSHMDKSESLKLTATRGKKVLHVIHRLDMPATDVVTLAQVLELVPKVKGQKTKESLEKMIEALPFEDQITATETLIAHVDAMKAAA